MTQKSGFYKFSDYYLANKSLTPFHILNEFIFTTSEEKVFPMTLSRADETLFTYVKRRNT